MYRSVAFGTFTVLCNHYYHLVLEHFHHPKWTLWTRKQLLPPALSPQPWAATNLFSVSGFTYSGYFI